MGTKLQEMRNGCFAAALDDEPMLVLLARDLSSPKLARDWAIQRKADISMGRKPASDMVKVDEVFALADQMEKWRDDNDGAWRTGLFGGQKVDVHAAPGVKVDVQHEGDNVVITAHKEPMGENRDDMVRRGMLGRDA